MTPSRGEREQKVVRYSVLVGGEHFRSAGLVEQ